ncbi:MAG: Omp28-related outer membrane protein [Saprospiraceae bacterium]|nr:Omp28-related outer membrane protein [Saprospiraceae bacterium]
MKKWLCVCLLFCVVNIFSQAQEPLTTPETHVALVTKRTATWCTICGGFAWDMVKRLQDNYSSSQAIIVNAHHSSGSRLYAPVAKDWIDAFELSLSQPRFYVGSELVGSGSPNTESSIENNIQDINQESPLAQTGLQLFYEPQTRSIKVQTATRFFSTGISGKFKLGIYLLEKEVITEQAAKSNTAKHTNVLRESLTDDSFGNIIYQGETEANKDFNLELFYYLPEIYDVDNIIILSVIWNDTEDQITVVNANQSDQFELLQTTGISQLSIPGQFELGQNPIQDQLQILITPENHLPHLSWSIFHYNGQRIRSGYWENLRGHANRQSISTSQMADGFYFLYLQADQKAVRIPFVVSRL